MVKVSLNKQTSESVIPKYFCATVTHSMDSIYAYSSFNHNDWSYVLNENRCSGGSFIPTTLNQEGRVLEAY